MRLEWNVHLQILKTHCIHKQEKRLRINFSKQSCPLSAHVSWGFGFIWLLKQARTELKSLCVCSWMCVCAVLHIAGWLDIQTDVCCGSKLSMATRHYIFVLNQTRDTKQSSCWGAYLLSSGTNDEEWRNTSDFQNHIWGPRGVFTLFG